MDCRDDWKIKMEALHTAPGSRFDFHFFLPKNSMVLRKIQGKNRLNFKKIQPKKANSLPSKDLFFGAKGN